VQLSVLALNLRGAPPGSSPVDSIVRFVGDENVSVVCINGDVGFDVAERLNSLGLKYDTARVVSYRSVDQREMGSTVITQLPLLGSADRCISENRDPQAPGSLRALATRLGVSPGVNVDVFSYDAGCEDQSHDLDRLLDFVEGSDADLAPPLVHVRRRRGRPPRDTHTQKWADPVRLVLLAVTCTADGDAREDLAARGFAELTRSNDGACLVSLRPSLKPTRRIDSIQSLDADDGVRSSAFVAFEV